MQTKATPRLITDQLLAELACPNGVAKVAMPDDETQALLAMAVPEMAAELQRWRKVAQGHTPATVLALKWDGLRNRLQSARATLRHDGPVSRSSMRDACNNILSFSATATERKAAQLILDDMGDRA